MSDVVLSVGGMACSGCADAVTRAVEKAAPGARVSVDLATGKVTVAGAPSRDVVTAAIAKAGYEIKG